jgi:2-polyprenyl-6-hydroxyphenyl methylase/3-demethylubiquinone-9 3-methyltransferase
MKSVAYSDAWPASWRYSYPFDLQEVYGRITNRGYAYAYENRRRKTLELIREVIAPGGRILDVAAAQGNFTLLLAESGYRVTWNDLREELADYVRLKHERGDVQYAPGNVFDLEFAEPFDCALITEIIEHVAHPDQFLAKISSFLKPNGYVVLTTPNGAYFRNRLPRFSDCSNPDVYEAVQFKPDSDGHIFLLWPDELRSLCQAAGLKIEKAVWFTTPLTNGHVKLGWLLRVLPKKLVFTVDAVAQRLPNVMKHKFMVHTAVRCRKMLPS